MKKTKILFLIPTLSTGGGERVVSELSLHLPESIEKVIVLFKKEISYPYKGRVISLDVFIGGNLLLKIFNYFSGLLKFKRIVSSEKPDYVISFGHPANIINILSGAKSIVRVDNFYSSSCHGFGGNIYKFLIKILFNRAHMIIDVSKESAQDLIENFNVRREKIKVIYNPLNIREIEKLAEEPLGENYQEIFKNPVIINMGRLNYQKGQRYLIEAFREIKDRIKDAKLVILGNGELEKSLRDLSEKMGIGNDVYFLGWQENPFKFLSKSKLFILSSLWEGLPYVLMEAMACGLPIISFDCKSGPREILAPDTDFSYQTKNIEYAKYGILLEKENKKLLSQVATKILLDEDLSKKFSQSSRTRAMDFDIKNIIKEWDFLKHG